MRVAILKFVAACAATGAVAIAVSALSAVYPSSNLHGQELRTRHWVEFALTVVAVAVAAAWAGSRLQLRRSGLAGATGLILAVVLLRTVRTIELHLPNGGLFVLVPASLVAAMLAIAQPRARSKA